MRLTTPAGKAAQCRALEVEGCTLYFSYETLIGVEVLGDTPTPVADAVKYRRANEWGPTTGRHINACGLATAEVVTPETLELLAADALRAEVQA